MDKSYLQGGSKKDLEHLFSTYRVVMPHGLFYELLTGNAKASANCWSHIPQGNNPLELCKPIGVLLRYEIENLRPASIDDFFLNISFRFNAGLKEPDFDLGSEQRKVLDEWEQQVLQHVDWFLNSAQVVHTFFPDLLNTSNAKIDGSAIKEAKREVSSNISLVKKIFAIIRNKNHPLPDQIDEDWAFFRWTQVRLIYSLNYLDAYGIGPVNVPKVKVEHDLHDMEYCIIGALIGKMASRDRELQDNFRLVCPNGTIIS